MAGISVFVVAAVGGGLAIWRGVTQQQQAAVNSAENANAADRFSPLSIPLSEFETAGSLFVDSSKSLSINGQLKANNGFVIQPTDQPTSAVAGQIYYDQGTNELNYYNGAAFVPLINNQQSVTSIDSTSGAFTLGTGLARTANQLTNSGVLTVQGQAGNVTLTAGNGVAISGTTISSSGVLSLGGSTGAITVGTGLSVSDNQLKNSGIISVASASAGLTVTNDGNGNITLSTSGAGTGTVQSPGGTTNKIAKFTGVQTIADSLLTDDGTTVAVGGNLSVTGTVTLSSALTVGNGGTGSTTAGGARTNLGAAASGANSDITSLSGLTTALSVAQGGIGVGTLATNGVLVGNGTSAVSSVVAGSAGLCLISNAGAPTWQSCPGGSGGVTSLNSLTGALAIANASTAGSTITINDASTTQKGIAQFNSTNFSVSAGTVNTVQNISTTATPTFAGINTNAITPSTALTVGATSKDLTLQGATTLITSTSGANATQLTFVAPTANVTYRLQTAAAGTYDVCTTVGNCVGVGGSVSTSGGTTNQLAKFTSSNAIGDSIIGDNGTLVTVSGNLTVTGTTTLTTALGISSGGTGATTVAGARSNLNAASSGANSDITSLSGLTTALNVIQGGTGATSLTANGVLLGNGTSAISSLAAASSGLCLVSTVGAPTWQSCPGGGGVSSVDSLTGALTIANSSGTGSTITIDDATTAQKGIAQFNGANFSVSSGVVNTIQDIGVSAAPTFGRLTITSSQASNAMFLVNNTNAGASGNLLDLQLNSSSVFAVSPAGALTLSGTVNGQTISSTANFTGTLGVSGAASLSGGATVTGTLTANTITPSSSLTVGATGQSFLLQGASTSTITATSGASTTSLAFQTPTANVTYRFLTATAGTYDICTTVGNCAGVGGGVTTSGGTTNALAKFTSSNAIGDSIISDDGSTVTIGGTLAVNTLTPTAALTVGDVAQDLTLQGATVNLTSTSGGITNSLTFATPAASNKTITIPNASGTLVVSASAPLSIDANGNISCPSCVTSAVTSLDSLTGALTIANSSGTGSTVTIDDASTSQKGIAQFNSTNFSASGGVINTIQNINTSATPTFGRLTVTSSQASNGMLLVNNTNASGTGNLIDLQLNSSSVFAVSPAGALTLSSTINGQTISSAANLTGTLAVAGATSLNGGATVTGTLTANTITPSSSLTVGATAQSFTLQGNASSTITSTDSGFTTTLAFEAPTASVTYRLLTAAAGTYDICTTVGNCAGVGGGVTTAGGTTNQIAKFTGSGSIGDSIITDNGSTVTIGGTLAVNTITPAAAMTIGATTQNLTLQGAVTQLTSTSGGVTNTLTFATPASSNKTITLPNATGTVAVSASGPLSLDANGNISCPTCVTSGGGGGGSAAVDSLDGLTGTLTIANSSGTGSTITIDDASTSQKGIAQFNSTNFSVSSGTVNTIQDINVSAAPTFGRLTVTSSQATNATLLINNTNVAASGNLLDVQLNGSSVLAVTPAGDMTLTGTLNGQTISSSASFSGTLAVTGAASLNGGATVTGTLTANTITPSSSLTVGATSQSFLVQGTAASTITANDSGFATTLAFQTPTADVTYRFLTATAGTYDVCTTVGNCAGVGGGVTTAGGTTNQIAKFTGSGAIGDSIISDDGSTVTIGGALAVNTLTPTSALTIGATGQNLTLQGASVNLTSTSGGITNSLTFATPASSNKTITIPNASGTLVVSASGPLAIDSAGNITCTTCTTTSTAVTSLNSQTGAVTLANATAASGTVTINNASTAAKGIAQFNSTNFSASSGTINTIQNINTSATPSFGRLTLSSSQASAVMLTLNNTNAAATGNLIDLQLNGSSKLSVSPAGALTLSSTINGQTISSAASFTGTLATAGLASLNGGATVTGTLTANTVTPSSSLTIGATGQSFTLQGNASSSITATSTGITNSLVFATPATSNKTITLPNATGTVCLDSGNCLGGSGGGANTALSNLTGVAINTDLLPGTAGGIDLGSATSPFGDVFLAGTSTTPGTNNFQITGVSTGGTRVITLPDASGTVCLQSSSSCGFAATTGGSGYIQNGTSVQTANFAIQSASAASIAALVKGAASQSAAIFQVQNSGGTALFTVGNFNDSSLNTNLTITGQGSSSDVALKVLGNSSQSGTNLLADFQQNDGTSVARITHNGGIYMGNISGVAGSVNISSGSSFATINTTTLTTDRTITLPNVSGTVCLDSGNCGTTTGTLQAAYGYSAGGSTPEIKLDTSRVGLDVQDADTTLGSSNNFLSFRASNSLGLGSIVFGWGIQGSYYQRPTADSVTTYQVTNSAGNNVFTVDTTNGRVGINLGGSANPGYTLEVKGDLNVGTGVYRSGGTAGLTATTCSSGQVMQNIVVNGGIVTGGTCTANGGTLQTAYNASTNPEITVDATRGALTVRDASSAIGANLFEVQNNAGSTSYFAVTASRVNTAVPLTVKTNTDSTTALNVKTSLDNNVFTVDTTNNRVGIGLGGNNTPTLTNEGVEILGSVRISGDKNYEDTYTTPAGANVATRINIATYAPNNFGQILAFGLPAAADSTTRALSLFDARTVAHQPTLGVFSVDENNLAGFSWEGGSTNAYVKTTGGNLILRSGTTDIMTLLSGGNVGVGVSPSYKLDVAGSVNVSSGNSYKIGGTDICTSSGCTPSAGSSNYIQNGTSVQSANLYVQAASSGSVGAIIRANAAGSGDILDLKNGSGTNIATFSSIGAALFQNSFDSTSALTVKNAAGTGTVLNVDTSNGRVGVGGVSSFSKFEVQGGDAAIYNSGNNPRLILGDSTSAGQNGYLQWDSTNDYFRIETAGTNGLKVNDNFVSIGNIFPGEPLTVGNGSTELFKVASTGATTVTGTLGVSGNLSTSALLSANSASITTNLGVSGTTSTSALSVTNDGNIGGNSNITGTLTAGGYYGGGLTDCDASNSKLLWDSSTNHFSCGTDRASVGIRKTADETVSSTTTMQNDDNFSFSVGANETWAFQIFADVKSSAAGDFRSGISAPSGATCRYSSNNLYNVTNYTTALCGDPGTTDHSDGNDNEYTIYGTVVTGATAGTVNWQWAQGTSSANSTIVRAGSQMIAYKLSGADVAEAYYTHDSSVSPGDVVQVDGSLRAGVKKSDSAYSQGTLGVVSTEPGYVLGDPSDGVGSDGKPVILALNGRVPVKVSMENGTIHAGDYLTASSTPGVAMRATKPGQIIGTALEDYSTDSPSGVGVMDVFVNPGWASPQGEGLQLAGNTNDVQGTTSAVFEKPVAITDKLTVGDAFSVDAEKHQVVVGPANDQYGTLLVLGRKVTAGDPEGTNGAMYYNEAAGKFRCFEDGAWKDCISSGTTTTASSITSVTLLAQDSALPDCALSGTPRTLGDCASAGADSRLITKTDLSDLSEARLVASGYTANGGGHIRLQYSVDGTHWQYLDQSSGPSLGTGSSPQSSDWVNLAADAKQDVWLRAVVDGTGTLSSLTSVIAQFK